MLSGPGQAQHPGGLEVPACCPCCAAAFVWEVEIAVDRELAWAHPHAPTFPFACPGCGARVEITFRWALQPGAAARHLRLVADGAGHVAEPAILLVDRCPHGCGTKLALMLSPDDPFFCGRAWPDEVATLGGYRCPTCDGEGRLLIQPVVRAGDDAPPAGGEPPADDQRDS